MQCIAFTAPVLPGKTETDRAAMESVAHGERKAAHASSRRRHGITWRRFMAEPASYFRRLLADDTQPSDP
jgi:hypothetical protein